MSSPAPSADAHAVVIGAGIAGLTAARVLAGQFRSVTVLDRDELPDTAQPRRGVPQGAHSHLLLDTGRQAFEKLFPGLFDDMVADGALPYDPGLGIVFYRFGAVWRQAATGLTMVASTRPLLEHHLRMRVAALPNVRIRAGVAVRDLVGSGGRITGVTLDDGSTIEATLVVDCTGRGARSDRWLAVHGFPAPRVSEVKVNVGYASRFYRRRPGDLSGANGLFVLPEPPHEKRAGSALAVEGDRWLVSMGGWHGDYPKDERSFVEHARSLPHQGIAELMERCEPLTDVVSFTFPANRRRHFEELRSLPAGFLALGDAVSSFNPVYGQGMTCTALQAVALDELFAQGTGVDAELPHAYYRRTAQILAVPEQFAVGGDFVYPQTVGVRPRGIGLMNWYSRRLQLAAQVDLAVRQQFALVQNLLVPPGVLAKPGMMLRVLRSSRRALKAQQALEAQQAPRAAERT